VANGVQYGANGQGFGLLGLPGDYTPPSRFVKTAVLTTLAVPGNNAQDAINLAEHVINNVDITRGVVREGSTGNIVNETTQWVDFKDLTHKVFYYRTYDNMTLRSVSLAKVNFAPNAPRLKMPIENGAHVQDVSSQFLGTAK
jgi:choloylglycine hydrolase